MCCLFETIWLFMKTVVKPFCFCCTCALQTICCTVGIALIICLAVGLGVYFGVFHNRDSDSDSDTRAATPSSVLLRSLMPESWRDDKDSQWIY
ncbi:protein midgut expression 1-like isoform X2 [Anopheles bellator]|uniref:protein midgut expression 1-like isoform X2 n=1 Tax=Anopheles bellator TaxID=139047 RepID=UPI002647953E|nr:protein midgut expression 1-like isoform X2 [Anopheles bellator]